MKSRKCNDNQSTYSGCNFVIPDSDFVKQSFINTSMLLQLTQRVHLIIPGCFHGIQQIQWHDFCEERFFLEAATTCVRDDVTTELARDR